MIKRKRIKCNEIMNLCFEHTTERWKTEDLDTRISKVSGMIFRTYSELDLKELEAINKEINEKSGKLQNIDPESVLSTYEG